MLKNCERAWDNVVHKSDDYQSMLLQAVNHQVRPAAECTDLHLAVAVHRERALQFLDLYRRQALKQGEAMLRRQRLGRRGAVLCTKTWIGSTAFSYL